MTKSEAEGSLHDNQQLGSGPDFDPETYAIAKPLFLEAAAKFGEFANNVAELVKRMVGEMRTRHANTSSNQS